MELILASASPRRQALLRLITPKFRVIPADTDETIPSDLPPEKAASFLAQKKAQAIAAQYPDALVLAADTTVLLGKQILGKPVTSVRAVEMLRLLFGKTHQVVTGVTLQTRFCVRSFSVKTDVVFYPLTETQIVDYVATGEPLDKAGGYGIQGKGALLIREIYGDYYNVVGLPISLLARELEKIQNRKECT